MMTERATAWSVTINLKTVSKDTAAQCMETAKSLGWGVQGQLERGEQGTEHYQLMVRTPQVRFSSVKKVFPTAHIEVCRNFQALSHYVQKEETRVESLKKIEVTFLTYPMVRNKFFEWLLREHDWDAHTRNTERRLELWDEFIGASIREGVECDLIGMNPQHRGCIAKYWTSYIAKETSRQTDERRQDRQTDTLESVVVPTI